MSRATALRARLALEQNLPVIYYAVDRDAAFSAAFRAIRQIIHPLLSDR